MLQRVLATVVSMQKSYYHDTMEGLCSSKRPWQN